MIPKIIHQIWIGDKEPPLEWMKTWKEKNPDWQYILWDNNKVKEMNFVNQKHIDYYWQKKQWHGVADLMRYEILFKYGGFMPGADSICLESIDDLFLDQKFDAYGVYENEQVRAGLVSPLYACSIRNEFCCELIIGLSHLEKLGEPWRTTGNLYMQGMIEQLKYKRLKIWPSCHFIPVHFTGCPSPVDGKIYATQEWGTTKKCYDKGR